MNKKSGIKNIIFDLGNTLVYFDLGYFYSGVAEREKRLNAAKFKKFIIKNRLDIKLITGRLNHKDFFRKLKRKFDLKIGYNDFIYFYSDIFWVNENMKRFLEKISGVKKYKLYLLSNTDSPHINFIDRNFPFIKIIKNRVLSYKINMAKPDKKIFKYTIDKFKLLPEETVLIDDIKENLLSAQKLGINTIHYSSHRKFTSEFSKLIKSVR